ncbi:MAG: hypothetical protein LCH62_05055 [Proteobacteria bacterium]|nr:hypothetical protein [Pseudomonadota bacterium]
MREVTLDELPQWLRDLHAMWAAKKDALVFPPRASFVVEDFMPWIGRLHLVEVLPDDDFRFVIYGASTNVSRRRDYSGLKLSEIADPLARIWEQGYRNAVAARTPQFFHHPIDVYAPREERVSWWRAILPLGDGGKVTHLLVGFQVIAEDGRYL